MSKIGLELDGQRDGSPLNPCEEEFIIYINVTSMKSKITDMY